MYGESTCLACSPREIRMRRHPRAAFHETLAGLAWSEGPNVRIDLFLQ